MTILDKIILYCCIPVYSFLKNICQSLGPFILSSTPQATAYKLEYSSLYSQKFYGL